MKCNQINRLDREGLVRAREAIVRFFEQLNVKSVLVSRIICTDKFTAAMKDKKPMNYKIEDEFRTITPEQAAMCLQESLGVFLGHLDEKKEFNISSTREIDGIHINLEAEHASITVVENKAQHYTSPADYAREMTKKISNIKDIENQLWNDRSLEKRQYFLTVPGISEQSKLWRIESPIVNQIITILLYYYLGLSTRKLSHDMTNIFEHLKNFLGNNVERRFIFRFESPELETIDFETVNPFENLSSNARIKAIINIDSQRSGNRCHQITEWIGKIETLIQFDFHYECGYSAKDLHIHSLEDSYQKIISEARSNLFSLWTVETRNSQVLFNQNRLIQELLIRLKSTNDNFRMLYPMTLLKLLMKQFYSRYHYISEQYRQLHWPSDLDKLKDYLKNQLWSEEINIMDVDQEPVSLPYDINALIKRIAQRDIDDTDKFVKRTMKALDQNYQRSDYYKDYELKKQEITGLLNNSRFSTTTDVRQFIDAHEKFSALSIEKTKQFLQYRFDGYLKAISTYILTSVKDKINKLTEKVIIEFVSSSRQANYDLEKQIKSWKNAVTQEIINTFANFITLNEAARKSYITWAIKEILPHSNKLISTQPDTNLFTALRNGYIKILKQSIVTLRQRDLNDINEFIDHIIESLDACKEAKTIEEFETYQREISGMLTTVDEMITTTSTEKKSADLLGLQGLFNRGSDDTPTEELSIEQSSKRLKLTTDGDPNPLILNTI